VRLKINAGKRVVLHLDEGRLRSPHITKVRLTDTRRPGARPGTSIQKVRRMDSKQSGERPEDLSSERFAGLREAFG